MTNTNLALPRHSHDMSLDLSATSNGCTWPETDVKQT
jgi:hypothetical protein